MIFNVTPNKVIFCYRWPKIFICSFVITQAVAVYTIFFKDVFEYFMTTYILWIMSNSAQPSLTSKKLATATNAFMKSEWESKLLFFGALPRNPITKMSYEEEQSQGSNRSTMCSLTNFLLESKYFFQIAKISIWITF